MAKGLEWAVTAVVIVGILFFWRELCAEVTPSQMVSLIQYTIPQAQGKEFYGKNL